VVRLQEGRKMKAKEERRKAKEREEDLRDERGIRVLFLD
jgi:hypothetical protein